MQWNPHLAFDGRCKEAFEFYERSLGGKVVAMIPYGDNPAKEHMPISETFWVVRFGMLGDKFGVPWMVNCEKASPA